MATIAVGAVGVGLGTNLAWTAIAVVAGCLFGTFFMAFHSTQGPQLGLPQMVQSRPQFGYVGALLVWIVALVTYIGYTAFNEILAGSTAQHLAHVPPEISYVGFGVLAALLAAVGYDWIHRASRWLTYVMLVVLAVFSAGIIVTDPFTPAELDLSHFSRNAFLVQFFVAAAYQLSWAIYVSDYSRYLPPNVRVRSSFWWTYIGAFIGGAWMMLVGTVAAGLFRGSDVVLAVQKAGDGIIPGLGTTMLVVSFVTLLAVTTLNLYGASLTMLSVVDSLRPIRATLAKRVGAVAIAVVLSLVIAFSASANFLAQFGSFLGFLLLLFTPWTAINLIDFYVVRHSRYSIREIFNPHGLYHRWSWRGLLAYGVGFGAMLPFSDTGLFTGPAVALLGGTDISMLVGLVVSAGVYMLACRSLDVPAEARRVIACDQGLDPDAPKGIPYEAIYDE